MKLNHRNTLIISAGFVLLISIGYYTHNLSFNWIALPVGFYTIMTILGVSNIQMNYFIESICEVPNSNNKFAITFDDGPNEKFTGKVLDLLGKYNAKATFFCIGKNVEKHPEILKKLNESGHQIGGHTYSHNFSFDVASVNNVINEIKKCNDLIEQHSAQKVSIFRPPFGVTNPKIAKAIKKLKLTSIGWSIRTLDTTNDSEDKIFKRLALLKSGDIVLLHDTSQKSINVLERLLKLSAQKKLESVTINELLNSK